MLTENLVAYCLGKKDNCLKDNCKKENLHSQSSSHMLLQTAINKNVGEFVSVHSFSKALWPIWGLAWNQHRIFSICMKGWDIWFTDNQPTANCDWIQGLRISPYWQLFDGKWLRIILD